MTKDDIMWFSIDKSRQINKKITNKMTTDIWCFDYWRNYHLNDSDDALIIENDYN